MELQSSDLKKYNFFSSLSDDGLEALSRRIKAVNYPAGIEILREGSAGDSFFFIRQGRIEVTKKAKSGRDAKISVIGSGQGFGEMALLTCSARSCSLRSLTEVTLLELAISAFEEIVLTEAAFKNMLLDRVENYTRYNRIKTLQPFELLEPAAMYAVMEKMSEKIYPAGADIITQGDRGDNYYIIKSGRVAVLKRKGDEEYKQVAFLGEGEAFGEEALIRDDPRNATCRTVENTTVYALDKKDFNQIVKAAFLENIFPEDIDLDNYLDRYVIIDARIPAEYEEEHIQGAINIPVEALRNECETFDRSKTYITYCLNDARGMVAAFLLKNRGFNARCLRGGISGWEGPLVSASDGVHLPEGP